MTRTQGGGLAWVEMGTSSPILEGKEGGRQQAGDLVVERQGISKLMASNKSSSL